MSTGRALYLNIFVVLVSYILGSDLKSTVTRTVGRLNDLSIVIHLDLNLFLFDTTAAILYTPLNKKGFLYTRHKFRFNHKGSGVIELIGYDIDLTLLRLVVSNKVMHNG